MSAHNCIILTAAGLTIGHEFKAGEAGIKPGHLLEQTSAQGVTPSTCLRLNNASTVGAPFVIAIENDLLGGTKDDAYALNDTVFARACPPGTIVQVRVAANAAAIAVGAAVSSNGDGGVKIAAAADEIIGEALEALDNSANAAEAFLRIRVR